MKVLINYSDHYFRKSQTLNSKSGLRIGRFNRVISFSPKDIDSVFFRKNQKILSKKKGAGYWLWKPYFIYKTLMNLQDGDYLFYADSGSYFINPIDHLIKIAEKFDQNVLFFENRYIEKAWTKRDAFILMGCDKPKFTNSSQRQGGFSLWKKSKFSMEFAEEYLCYCQDERIITDNPNTMGLPNYHEFIQNRHDQSVSSLLAKKYNIPPFRMVSQFGNKWIDEYPNSDYPQLIQLTRKKNIPLMEKLIKNIKTLITSRYR